MRKNGAPDMIAMGTQINGKFSSAVLLRAAARVKLLNDQAERKCQILNFRVGWIAEGQLSGSDCRKYPFIHAIAGESASLVRHMLQPEAPALAHQGRSRHERCDLFAAQW